MAALTIKCLGNFQVTLDGKHISSFDLETTRALCAYLAVEQGKPQPRSYLAGLLWSDEPEERALHNLRQTRSSLRKALGDSPSASHFILSDRDTIRFHPAADVWVDTAAFTRHLDAAFRCYQRQKGSGWLNIRHLQQAMALYTGPFLSQFHLSKSALFEEWALLTREKFNLQAIQALAMLSEYHERRGEYHPAIQYAMRITEFSPWDENARAQVIRLLGMDGQWNAAQSQFFALQNYLSQELGVSPSTELTALQAEIASAAASRHALPSRFPPARLHLPESSTSFVGREAELDDLMELLVNPENRLLTLLGPGGIGKTSLALAAAHQIAGMGLDGIYFVSLLAAQQAGQISAFIGEAAGLAFSDQSDPQKQIFAHLRHKEVLLLLDNFEHLLTDPASTAFIDELLHQAPGLKLLVTSRERLMLQQERVFPLGGLAFPSEPQIPLPEAQNFDALNLFVRRAGQIQPGFVLTSANLPAVIRICRLLEGFPLGVELAAAAIWEHGTEGMAGKIEGDLDVLTSRFTNLPPRHRSLRAAFEVSWERLSEREQDALCRLSVFQGGMDRLALPAIADATPHILSNLVAKSLLRLDENQRFHLHEVIRRFLLEKLNAAGKADETRARHARFYVDFLARQNPALQGADQPAALAALQQEFGNLNLMWDWLVENGCCAEITRCVDSLYQFFSIRSLFSEGLTWFQHALGVLPVEPLCDLARGMLLSRVGGLAYSTRQTALAGPALLQAEEIFRRNETRAELAHCQVQLGWLFQREKDLSASQRYGQQALDYFQRAGDELGQSQALTLMGLNHLRQGSHSEAAQSFNQALEFCRRTQNPRQLAAVLNRLADLACYQGQYDQAVAQFSECLEISRQINDRFQQAVLLNNLGTIYHVRGELPRAEEYYRQSLELCQELGDQDGMALALNNLGELATARGDLAAASQFSRAALKIAQEIGENWTVIVCLNSLGEIHREMDALEASRNYFSRALALALRLNEINMVSRIAVNMARNYQLQAQQAEAIVLLRAALACSATEHDARQQAIQWLGEMQADARVENDDSLLLEVIEQLKLNSPLAEG